MYTHKSKWDSLSLKDKSEMMRAAVQSGIYSLDAIKQVYNEYAEGGNIYDGTTESTQQMSTSPRPITTGGAGYVPPSSSNVQVFNKEKIYNRVLPTEMTGANTGPLDSVKQYLFNNDRAVDEWFEDYVPYINNSYGDAIKASRIVNDLYREAGTEKEQEFLENSSTMKSLINQQLAPEMFVQEDGKDTYLGMPQRFGTMMDAEYQPANGKLVNGKYISYMRDPIFVDTEIIPTYQDYIMGITREDNPETNVQRVTKNGNALVYMPFLNNATMSKGYDPNRGEYISIYDDWDYNTAVLGKAGDNISNFIGGQPFSIYDRYYLDDIYDVPRGKRGSYYLPEVTVTPEKKALGGPLVQRANKYEEDGPYKPGTIYGRPTEQGLVNVYPEYDLLAGGRTLRNVAKFLYKPFKKQYDEDMEKWKRWQQEKRRRAEERSKKELSRKESDKGEISIPQKKEIPTITTKQEEPVKTFVEKTKETVDKGRRLFDNGMHGILKQGFYNDAMHGFENYYDEVTAPENLWSEYNPLTEEYAYGGSLVNRANQYALGGNMYGWGDFLKGSYNSIKDTASNVVDKAGDALISAANWLHDALKVDSPTPTATTKPYVEQDYTSPAFMPYSYGSTSNYNVDDSSWDETKEVQLPEITITTDKVLKELPVEKLSQNEYLRNEYNKDNSVEEAKKLNREDLKKLQQTLADKGYYDLNTDNMSVDEIKNIQKKIGAKVDGIAGKETREKWRQYNVDGLWGKRTEEAVLKGTKKDYWDRDVTTDNTEWCAEWVHKKAVNATGNDNCGVRGDAWRMPQNVVKSGGTEVYNIYNDKAFRGITDVTSLKKATEKALKEHPFDISTLQVGDIVGIYMPSSDMHSTALRDGTTFNTHVGVVTGFDKNGKPIIEHNIHKNHHKDAADNIKGSLIGKARIATVSRPDYGTPQKAFEVESAPSEYTKESDSPLFKQYAESAAGSKELLQNVFPNVDIDEVERIALAVQGRETGFMKNKRSDQTGISGLKVKAGDYYRDNIIGKNAESVSSNLAKMKLTSFDPNERYMLGLTDPKDLEDPKKAGTAAMYLMAKNYSYFKNLQESYPQLGITDDDIRYLTELSYNQGMSKLRNIGFTSEGAAAPEELEAIRAMADENAKIKDVSATNYRYLGSLGEMLYDAFADGHTPYIAAAEKYRRQLMENANTE